MCFNLLKGHAEKKTLFTVRITRQINTHCGRNVEFLMLQLKDNKTVSGFRQTQQYILLYFFIDDMFR